MCIPSFGSKDLEIKSVSDRSRDEQSSLAFQFDRRPTEKSGLTVGLASR